MAIEEIRKAKIDKIKELRKSSVDPYPADSNREFSVADALKNYEEWKENKVIVLAGRILAKREHGGSTFLDLNDGSGKIQVYIKQDGIGKEKYKEFEDAIDIGDFI